MAPTTDIEFRASDLIGTAGVGSNGEKLVNTLLDAYPADLQAAQLKRINPVLDAKINGDDSDKYLAQVAKIAGVDRVEGVHVRGGLRRADEAVVTYAFIDSLGVASKGAFPYNDLGKASSDGHVSQRDALANSAVGRQHIEANPRRSRAEQEADATPVSSDPFADLAEASADDLIAQMREHPDRADGIKAFEKATRGKSARKTVLDFDPSKDANEGK